MKLAIAALLLSVSSVAWAQKKPALAHRPAKAQKAVVTSKADAAARKPAYTRHQVEVATKPSARTKPIVPTTADTQKAPPLSADEARDVDGVDWAHVEEMPAGCSSSGPCL